MLRAVKAIRAGTMQGSSLERYACELFSAVGCDVRGGKFCICNRQFELSVLTGLEEAAYKFITTPNYYPTRESAAAFAVLVKAAKKFDRALLQARPDIEDLAKDLIAVYLVGKRVKPSPFAAFAAKAKAAFAAAFTRSAKNGSAGAQACTVNVLVI